jgi:hypothetical protein
VYAGVRKADGLEVAVKRLDKRRYWDTEKGETSIAREVCAFVCIRVCVCVYVCVSVSMCLPVSLFVRV